jgi:hypothetical protein
VSGTGVMINKIYGNQSVAEHSPHKSYSILLGDIYYEEVRHNVLARVSCVVRRVRVCVVMYIDS